MNKLVVLLALGLSVSLSAQQQAFVVPVQNTAAEGLGQRRLAGFGADVRQQIIVSAEHLKPLAGRALVGLSFRRDRGLNIPFEGGWVALSLSLSTSRRLAANPSYIMAENVGSDQTEVFSGKLELPSSGVLSAEIAPWDTSTTAHLVFSLPFPYHGGDLCIELRPLFNLPVTDISRWPVDAAVNPTGGSVEVVGPSCSTFLGAPSEFGPTQSSVSARDLVIGHSARFSMRGTPNGGAMFLIGSQLEPALDLGMLGLPGCLLQVSPSSRIYVTSFAPPIVDWAPEFGGRANATLEIPASTSLLGAEFYSQWVDMGPPIMTSNTLHITISSDLPTLGMSIVSAPYEGTTPPQIGHVSIDVGQVMRFDYR